LIVITNFYRLSVALEAVVVLEEVLTTVSVVSEADLEAASADTEAAAVVADTEGKKNAQNQPTTP
jgi:hypothetical protein